MIFPKVTTLGIQETQDAAAKVQAMLQQGDAQPEDFIQTELGLDFDSLKGARDSATQALQGPDAYSVPKRVKAVFAAAIYRDAVYGAMSHGQIKAMGFNQALTEIGQLHKIANDAQV